MCVSSSCRISRSETSEWIRSRQSSFSVTVSEYQTEALLCDGSELSFEEVRAAKYLRAPPEARAERREEPAVEGTGEEVEEVEGKEERT